MLPPLEKALENLPSVPSSCNDLVFYIPFNIIEVISRQWKSDNERLQAMKHRTVMSLILPPAKVELGTS